MITFFLPRVFETPLPPRLRSLDHDPQKALKRMITTDDFVAFVGHSPLTLRSLATSADNYLWIKPRPANGEFYFRSISTVPPGRNWIKWAHPLHMARVDSFSGEIAEDIVNDLMSYGLVTMDKPTRTVFKLERPLRKEPHRYQQGSMRLFTNGGMKGLRL